MDVPIVEGVALGKLATSSASISVFKSAMSRVEQTVKGPARAVYTKALASLQGYSAYLEDTHNRVSTFKTFANPTQPVSLLDHFVTTEFEIKGRKKKFTQDDLIARLSKPSRLVVQATAGFGKSMVMRYISLALFENPIGLIPIFLELRHLNRVKSPDIVTYIHATYRRVSEVQIEALKQGLKSGAFVMVLDGFDELNHDLRPIIESQILELVKEYPLCSVIVSGRPDDRFLAWREFTTLKIKPMGKLQIIELLNKLEYDSDTKKRFITKIKKGLYETHESFLSTPLLAILMLLTYEQNANIPDKIHMFYAKAFETLFHKHDALKEQYERARKSPLQVDEFEKVFSIFCLKTYVQEKTEFTKTEILSAIRMALEYEKQAAPPADFLFDIEEAVCLMMREGTSYFFVHRSFQEYFTAVFLSNCAQNIRDSFINNVAIRYWDTVLPMLFDMAADQIEPTWVVQRIADYRQAVGFEDGKLSPLAARFEYITLSRGQDGAVHMGRLAAGTWWHFIAIMMRFYPEITYNGEVHFHPAEKWGQDNWDNLPAEEESFTIAENKIAIKKVLMKDLPDEVVERMGIAKLAASEYNFVEKIGKRVKKEQGAKNEFLDSLFSRA
jgi:hypothetical protein